MTATVDQPVEEAPSGGKVPLVELKREQRAGGQDELPVRPSHGPRTPRGHEPDEPAGPGQGLDDHVLPAQGERGGGVRARAPHPLDLVTDLARGRSPAARPHLQDVTVG